MQNETIDKLKNAGYITSTADSQGIADQVGISGGDAPNLYFYVDTSDTEHVIVEEESGRVMINIMDQEGDYLSELFNEFNKNVENNIYPKIVITTDVLPRAINQFELYGAQELEDGMEGVMYDFISPNMGIIDSAYGAEPYTFNYMVLYYAKDDEFDGYVMVLDNISFGSDDKNYLEVPEGTELTTDADYIAGYDNDWIPYTGANTKIPTCDIINRAFIYTNNDITKSELESQNGRLIDETVLHKMLACLFTKFIKTIDMIYWNFMRVPYIPSELETILDTYKPDVERELNCHTYAAYVETTDSKKCIVIYKAQYDGESTFRIKLITIS